MPYNPYSPGGPLFRATVATPTNSQDAELRSAYAQARSADLARETAPQPALEPVTLASDTARGRRYITRSGESILVRPGFGIWGVYPCGPRGGVVTGASRLGLGSTPQDALEAAGYREVAK